MPCEEYRPLIRRMGEGDLPPEQARLLEDHLPTCEDCRKAARLAKLDDTAVRDALLGLPAAAPSTGSPRRMLRIVIVASVLVGVVLLAMYWMYRSFEERARVMTERRTGALALERAVLPRAIDLALPVLVMELAKQIEAPLEHVPRRGTADDAPPNVTLDLKRRIRLRSALALLAEAYGVTFLVGEDRVAFPPPGAPAPEAEGTEALRRRLREKRTTLSFGGDRLDGALDHLETVVGLNVFVAPQALGRVSETAARLQVRDEPLADVLDRLLEPAALRWEVRHEVVVISLP